MKSKLFVFALMVVLTATTAAPLAAAPLLAPCAPGAAYDPACDVNHDGVVNVLDVQLTAGHWNQTGTWTGGGDGWLLTGNAGTNPATNFIGTTDGQPLAIQPAGGNVGIGTSTPNARFNVVGTSWFQGDSTPLPAAAGKGIAIGFAGEQGYIYGFDYATWTHKNLIVQHDGGKVVIGSSTPAAAKLTVVAPAGETGVYVSSANNNGVEVGSAGWNGLSVGTAGADGVYVGSAGQDGLFICRTGSAGNCTNTAVSNGVEIGNAEYAGVYVNYAGNIGVEVGSAGSQGVYVYSAGDTGVNAGGNNLAGYFRGNINVTGNCIGCLQATFGVNAGDKPLELGDLVSLAGLRDSGVDSVPMLMEVQTAASGDAVVGVVQGWAELVTGEKPRPDEIGLRLVPREGPASPGQYVTIAYSGLMQVKVSGPIAQGSKLAVGTEGAARALRTVNLDGVELAENASVIGVALESLDAGDGLVWVLVNSQ